MSRGTKRWRVDAHDAARLASFVVLAIFACLIASFLSSAWGDDAAFQRRDFHPLWEAGMRARTGGAPYERWTQPFVHPPLALPLMIVLGLVPERVAFVLAGVVGIFAWGVALFVLARACRAPPAERVTGIVVASTAPALALTVFLGQLSSLYVAAFVGCLASLAVGAEVIAGVCAGLLAIKPPLVLALAFAIAVSRSKRAALAFAATLGALFLLSLPWIGTWSTWASQAAWWTDALERAPGTWWRQWTLYAFVRASLAELGAGQGVARIVSGAIVLPLALVVAWLAARALRHDETTLRLRAAALLALATVSLNAYLFYYDALLLVVPAGIAFWLRATYARAARRAVIVLASTSWALALVTPLFGQGGVPLPGLVATMWLGVEAWDLSRALREPVRALAR